MKRKASTTDSANSKKSNTMMAVPRIIAAGRGRVVQMAPIRSELFKIIDKEPSKINMVYLGTATYEDDESFAVQTAGFSSDGVNIERLNLTDVSASTREERQRLLCNWADAVLVSGGTTLLLVP
jgi:hypothetical protein